MNLFKKLMRALKAFMVSRKKPLPPVIGPELHLPVHLSYAIIRNRDTGDALKSEQDSRDADCWIKPINVHPFGEQLKIHLRWSGKDEKGLLGKGVIDQDIHLPIEALDDLAKLRDEHERKNERSRKGSP